MKIDKRDIEKRAETERMNAENYGIKDIFSIVSQKGIHLIRYPFGQGKLLGFATVFEGKRVIVSNSSEILSREIYTIAHELGHILFDFEDLISNLRIDFDLEIEAEEIIEKRAYYFADCFLMPEEALRKYIKYELNKTTNELNALDIVRLQLEFQVSYAALLKRLYDLDFISNIKKKALFDKRDHVTSRALFRMLNADQKLLKASNTIEVPSSYLEYVTSNYDNETIPFSSLEKALALIGVDASEFQTKRDDKEPLDIDIDELFEEFES